MTTRSLDSLSDEEFFRAWDSMTAFLEAHGEPKLVEIPEPKLVEDAAPAEAERDTGGRDDAG